MTTRNETIAVYNSLCFRFSLRAFSLSLSSAFARIAPPQQKVRAATWSCVPTSSSALHRPVAHFVLSISPLSSTARHAAEITTLGALHAGACPLALVISLSRIIPSSLHP